MSLHPSRHTITSAFAVALKARPEAIAVSLGPRSMTYRELDVESDAAANALWNMGVRPGQPVIIAAERTVETVVCTLAILKCGAFYVPVDPRWPASRIAHIVSVSGATLALFVDADELDCGQDVRRVRVNDLRSTTEPFRPVEACEQTIAYVMFTSGSTGVPKAIAIPHRAVVRLAVNPNYITIAPDDVLLYQATLAFDASTFEIWSALLNGCRLEICPPGVTATEVIRDRGVTVTFLTSGLFTVLIEEEADRLIRLRTLIVGGDVLSIPAARRALRKLPGTHLVNAYGPTENTGFTTCHTVTIEDTNGPIPIGRPIQETSVRVFDGNFCAVATGVEGELVTGGAGLAIGYYGNPALTAERFIPDPEANPPGARLYRTGDIVRQRENGVIEFVGRDDDQVKVNGFRIELGELEHAAVAYPGVREACAGVRNGRIHLWCIAANDFDRAGLHQFLRDRLPQYVVPAAIIPVDFFPLNANGKIDRTALPDPSLPMGAAYERRLETEYTIAQIWSEVLNIPLPANTVDFFSTGGDSLSAMRVMNRMRATFGCEISADDFFPNATVEQLARLTTQRASTNAPRGPFSFESGIGRRMPLTFSQERVFFLQQLEPDNLAYNFQSVIRFRGFLDVGVLRKALNRIIERHEIYRSTFEVDDLEPVQVAHEAGDAFLDEVDLSIAADPEKEFRRLVDAEVRWQANVRKLPLIRWVLYRVAADEFRLLHLENHLVHDGWSFNIFLSELIGFYREATEGVPARVRQPLQSGQFAAWQRSLLASGNIDPQLDYWTKKLAGAGAPLALPFDRPNAPKHRRGGHLRFLFDGRECAEIVDAATRNHCSPFVLMVTAFAELMHRECGTADVTIGTGFANRQHTAAESVITMAVNTIALRCDLSRRPTVGELLERTRRTVIEAQENQDAPFDRVVARVSPERRSGVTPMFNTMFSFHDSPDVDTRLRDLDVTVQETVPNGSTKFDLNIVLIRQVYDGRGRSGGAESWKMTWEYDADRFEERTIHRLVSRYRRLLKAFAASDSTLVADLEPAVSAEPAFDARQRVTARLAGESGRTEPASPTEEVVASVWTEVIGVPVVDRDADFFHLGGHSLLGLRITARLERRVGIPVPLSILFETRTVRTMAAALDGLIASSVSASRKHEEVEERDL
jgi:amino acid adenylation domain-containing protein